MTFRRAAPALALLAMLVALPLAAVSCRVGPPPDRDAARAVGEFTPYRGAERDGPLLRVRIERAVETVTLDAGERLALRALSGDEQAWSGYGPIGVRRNGGAFVLTDRADNRAIISGRRLVVAPASGLLRINGADHPGAARLVARSDVSGHAFDVVEEVAIERYLPGVLARELYAGWDAEAYEAQAVAARTYALHERNRRIAIGSHFDLESTTQDQAYGGAATNSRAAAAAKATRGLVLAWDGRLLRAYYSSTCGDRPASAADTWPDGPGFEYNLAAPLEARSRRCACDASPRHRWTLTRDATRLALRIRHWGKENGHRARELKGLRRVEVDDLNAAGRPSAYELTDLRGRRFTLSAEQLRLASNQDTPGLPEITMADRVLSGDVRVVVSEREAVIEGRGFGHGVGLCQFGAQGFAKGGEDAMQILRRFYPGARIERAY